ncbi:unnamed protein product [Sphagnum jensenii]|uniref:Uncharacterized protein n=1 Tax=Sphagnum jensenii TaxID=128206 RepID=A0ABP0WA41_9BRYO
MHMWMVKIHGQIVCKLKLWHLGFEITLLPQVPTTIPMTPMRHGPYHGWYPGMYQFHPPPPKCNVQMNPNSEEFIPRYLRE